MGSIIVYALLAALSVFVIGAWARWLSSDSKFTRPQWRSGIAAFGFAVSTASLVLIIVLAVHAVITGGLPYYHPILMLALRVGFATALLGIIAALIGKGQLEVPAVVCSLACLLIWFLEAMAQ